MDQQNSAVVVGAGIGGITTAIFLAQKGYQVTVFEKNQSPGGRCGQIQREGHRFDLGATILLMPSIYREVFQSIGLDFDTCFEKRNLQSLYRIFFPDGKSLDFSKDKEILQHQLELLEKGSYQQALQYAKTGYGFFNMAMKKLLGRNFTSFFQFATLRNVLLLIKVKAYMKHSAYIKRYFKHPHLQTAFTFQNIYVGQNPLTAPALFAMIPASELTEGSFFPVGGMFAIAKKLIHEAEKLGVRFQLGKAVTRIVKNTNRVTGIETADRTYVKADVVIANADLPYVYKDLLQDHKFAGKLDRMQYSCSAIVLHWGLSRRFDSLSHHNVFLSEDYASNLKKIFRDNSLAENPSFYVHAPCCSDPAAAPPDQDSLTIIIPSGHLNKRDKQDWNALKNAARKSVIKRLEEAGCQQLEQHIKFEITYLPHTWKAIFNLSRGATFGSLSHHILQMGYFRPHNRHRLYRNLYFTGGSTHPGNGVPLVLLSAKLTAERILNNI